MRGVRVVKVDPLNPDKGLIQLAAELIRRGGLVAFPTETVYGLGANALSDEAARRIFEAKGRPPDNPLIVHVASLDQALEIAEIPDRFINGLRTMWPGPITVVVKGRRVVSRVVTAGLDTVAVRIPAHPIALGLIEASGVPVAAPSANRSGKPSPTCAEHVVEDLDGLVDLVLDGGETFLGVESTVVDLTRDPPMLLRPGPIGVEELARVFGEVIVPESARGLASVERPLSPGLKYRHYAPDTPLVLLHDPRLALLVADLGLRAVVICGLGRCPVSGAVEVLDLGSTEYEVARNLFNALRTIDKMGVDVALAVALEERGILLAVMNRLRKAARGLEVRNCSELLNALRSYGLIPRSFQIPEGWGCRN